MKQNDMRNTYTFEIKPRPEDLGGGWKLSLLEDGEEVGGGIFEAGDDGYADAYNEGEEWIQTRQ